MRKNRAGRVENGQGGMEGCAAVPKPFVCFASSPPGEHLLIHIFYLRDRRSLPEICGPFERDVK